MDVITRIIDADIIINGKAVPVLNSDLSLVLSWSIKLNQSSESVDVDIQIKSLTGHFLITEVKESYKKETKYTISELIDWKYEVNIVGSMSSISPEHLNINFDTKILKIKF